MRISDGSSDVCSSDLVDDQARAAALLQVALHDLAHAGIGQVAARIHDQHVAGLDQGHGLVDEQVVARPRLDRQRAAHQLAAPVVAGRSEEHTSELQSLMRHSYAVFCLKKKKRITKNTKQYQHI